MKARSPAGSPDVQAMSGKLILKGGHVIDAAQGFDSVADVHIDGGKILAIGNDLDSPPGTEVLDLRGKFVTPGFIDIHVHAYGGIAFADPDSIGVNLGTTTMCDAGGAGAYSWDEFKSLIVGQTKTEIYLWLLLGAAGIYGFQDAWRTVRSLIDIPINRLLDIVEANRDVIVGLKTAGFAALGLGPVKIAKGVANVLGLPLYLHIGDILDSPIETQTAKMLDLLEVGDYVTHSFTPCPGNLIGKDGRILPEALAARDRGVWFDTAFGGFNFSFDVAERVLNEGIVPTTISSDLQQINITGPVFSLTHVMSAMMALGMSLHDVLRRVTINPARQLNLADRIGGLSPGMQGDISVFEVETGKFTFNDCAGGARQGDHLITPILTLKYGEVIPYNRELAETESNWSMESVMCYDAVPSGAGFLDQRQRAFLKDLAGKCRKTEAWDGVTLHETFHDVVGHNGIELGRAAAAVLDSFMARRFTPPVGFFLSYQDRDFVIARLEEVAGTL
jgi:dihydroorotase